MSEFDNTPITPPSSGAPGLAGWFPVWIKAVTQPNEQTFVDITEHPDMSAKTAYIWVFIAGTFSGIIQAIAQAISTATGIECIIPNTRLGTIFPTNIWRRGICFNRACWRALRISLCRLVVYRVLCSYRGDHPMDRKVIWRHGNI